MSQTHDASGTRRLLPGQAGRVAMEPHDCQPRLPEEVKALVAVIVQRAAATRLHALLTSPPPAAVYWLPDRHGVTTLAVRTSSLTAAQLRDIMTFRLAQYLLADQLDPCVVHAEGLEHEPLGNASPEDLHVLSGATETGEILAYMTIEAVGEPAFAATLSSIDRPVFPVEAVFGWGVYNRLKVVPDLPLHRIREMGRYIKTQMRPALDELVVRATAELSVAVLWLVGRELRHEIDAIIGDIEATAVKRALDFFQVPFVLVRGVVPYAAEGSFEFFNYQHRTRYPFAFLCSDIPHQRLQAVERALTRPGGEALRELLTMREQRSDQPSSVRPDDGLSPLNDHPFSQQALPMAVRRRLLDRGSWLREIQVFRSLSVPEAAVLATLVERTEVAAGALVIRQGDRDDDDAYLIETGTLDVNITSSTGDRKTVRALGPKDFFGEVSLLCGGVRSADVVATSPCVLLRLSKLVYEQYLAPIADVDRRLALTALGRLHDTSPVPSPKVLTEVRD